MNKAKPYKKIDDENSMIAAEPAVVYHADYLQGLKSRLMTTIKDMTDEAMLEQCLMLLQQKSMPCVYTDEEFIQVLAEAETSGFIEHEEALKEFEKWGFVR